MRQPLPFAKVLLDQIGLDHGRNARVAGREDRLGGALGPRQRADLPGRRVRQAAGQRPVHRRLFEQGGLAQRHVHRAVQAGARVLVHHGVADQPEPGDGHSPIFSSAPDIRAARNWPANTSAATAIQTAFSANAAARWSHRTMPCSSTPRMPSNTCADGRA